MKAMLNRRLSILNFALMGVGLILLGRLASFQFNFDTASYLSSEANDTYRQVRNLIPDRGRIFDRNGELLAGNMMEYDIGVSPNYITNKLNAAKELAAALGDSERRIYDLITQDVVYVRLANRVPTDIAQKIVNLGYLGVRTDPVPKRIYPQGSLAAHIVGFVGGEGDTRRGYVGIEGEYDRELRGQNKYAASSSIPFEINPNEVAPPGQDIYLTIDRSIQYLAETELLDAIERYGAVDGSIIIMDPRNGEILAMASYPPFDPNFYYKVDPDEMKNPAVSDMYEPGSVFKILTGSIALEYGGLDLNWTYNDISPFQIGGRNIFNWDRRSYGSQTFADVFVKSLNIGTSTLSTTIGSDKFYRGLKSFGVGQRTGVDLENEVPGWLKQPGDAYWSDSDLATNSFGQGVTVTALQMLAFTNAIANKGQIMKPHLRLKAVDGTREILAIPDPAFTPISPKNAQIMTDIMVRVIQQGEGNKALVPGYTIAGKTGTAQIPCDTCPDGFEPELHNVSFVGFLPADEPRVSIIIVLKKVSNKFASETAAPAFAKLVERLVVLMNIPTDEQRRWLRAQGGNPAQIGGR